jgi:polyisoprenoid-binding protein YceI
MSTSPVSLSDTDLTGRWILAPEDPARLTLTTKHLFGLGTVTATVALDDVDVDASAGVEHARIVVTARAGSFTSGHTTRDKHVIGPDFLHVQQHPLITFTGQNPTRSGTDPHRWQVPGQLTARGVTRPVMLELTATPAPARLDGAPRIRVQGDLTVDRTDHQLTAKPGMAGRRVHLAIDVLLRRA